VVGAGDVTGVVVGLAEGRVISGVVVIASGTGLLCFLDSVLELSLEQLLLSDAGAYDGWRGSRGLTRFGERVVWWRVIWCFGKHTGLVWAGPESGGALGIGGQDGLGMVLGLGMALLGATCSTA
jgi:hypothetical protein